MAGREWKWDQVKQQRKTEFKLKYKPIPTDQAFWRAWHADRDLMKKSGVILRKNGSRWLAFLEVDHG